MLCMGIRTTGDGILNHMQTVLFSHYHVHLCVYIINLGDIK